MKKLALAFIGLVVVLFQVGCATSSYCNANYAYLIPYAITIVGPFIAYDGIAETVDKCKKNSETLKQACPAFEKYDRAKILHKNASFRHSIIDYEKGLISVSIDSVGFSEGDDKEVYCNKLKPKVLSSETKSFAVNGDGNYDFNVKITKEIISADKVKEGKVIEKGIKMTAYDMDSVKVIEYQGRIYQADSAFIANTEKRLKDEYLKAERTLRDNLPCFESGGKAFCDGDLVRVLGSQLMIRVDKMSYGTVRYELYLYSNGSPITEASYTFLSHFRMNPPEVYGSHYLKEEVLPNPYLLSMDKVKTFKEW